MVSDELIISFVRGFFAMEVLDDTPRIAMEFGYTNSMRFLFLQKKMMRFDFIENRY